MYFSPDSNLGMLATTATQRLVAMEQQLCQTLQQQLTTIHVLQQQEWKLLPSPRTQCGLMTKIYELSARILVMKSGLIAQVTQKQDQKSGSIVDTLGEYSKQLQTALQAQQKDNERLVGRMPTAAALPSELQAAQQPQLRWLAELQLILSSTDNMQVLSGQLRQVHQSLCDLTKLLPQLPQQPQSVASGALPQRQFHLDVVRPSPVKPYQNSLRCVACHSPTTNTNGRCADCSPARA